MIAATVVYRYSLDMYVVGWQNGRVAATFEEAQARSIADALDKLAAAGFTITTHEGCDGADISNGKIRYYLAPLMVPNFAATLV